MSRSTNQIKKIRHLYRGFLFSNTSLTMHSVYDIYTVYETYDTHMRNCISRMNQVFKSTVFGWTYPLMMQSSSLSSSQITALQLYSHMASVFPAFVSFCLFYLKFIDWISLLFPERCRWGIWSSAYSVWTTGQIVCKVHHGNVNNRCVW